MNLSNKFWFRLQENIGPLIFLSILQIIMTIMFPGHAFLGTALNMVMKVVFGVGGIICLTWLFTSSDQIEDGFIFSICSEYEEPQRTWLRAIAFAASALTIIVGSYCMYKIGCYNYSKSYYILMGIDVIFLYYFLFRAVQKRKQEKIC